jgi:hypothetical protein
MASNGPQTTAMRPNGQEMGTTGKAVKRTQQDGGAPTPAAQVWIFVMCSFFSSNLVPQSTSTRTPNEDPPHPNALHTERRPDPNGNAQRNSSSDHGGSSSNACRNRTRRRVVHPPPALCEFI